jgi:hypothetical protein
VDPTGSRFQELVVYWELGSSRIRQLQLKITLKVESHQRAAIVDNKRSNTGDQDLSSLASSSSEIAVWQQKWTSSWYGII